MPQSLSRYWTVPSPILAQLGRRRHLLDRVLRVEAVELAGVHQASRAVVRLGACVVGVRVRLRLDDDRDREAVLPRELEVALIVPRNAHHRAGAVLAEHEVRDPDRDRPLVNGLMAVRPVSKPSFSISPVIRAVRSCAWKRLACRANSSPAPGFPAPLLDERMLRCQHHEVRAVDCVDARGEDLDIGSRLGGSGTRARG